MRTLVLLVFGVSLPGMVFAQSSPSYNLQEQTFNSGGVPQGGNVLTSAHFMIKLDAVGGAPGFAGIVSPGYRIDAGFVATYPPPGEVGRMAFAGKTVLGWSPEPSAANYEVYRNTLTSLPGNFGACFASALATTAATDTETPVIGSGFFYLITARNRLNEEGTKGFASGGERGNPSPCP